MSSTRHFGVLTNTGSLSGIIVNNLSNQETTDTAEARNQLGQVIDQASYSVRKTFSIDGLWVGGGVHAGTIVTVDGESVLVTDATKTESNTDFQKGSLTAVKADNAELWDIATISGQVTP